MFGRDDGEGERYRRLSLFEGQEGWDTGEGMYIGDADGMSFSPNPPHACVQRPTWLREGVQPTMMMPIAVRHH